MKIDLAPNETLIREGPANLQRGLETVGGRLLLTDQRLVFSSHGVNVQTGRTEIPLAEIRSVSPCWTKFLGLLPLAPNSLAVSTSAGEHRLVISGRSQWASAITSAAASLGA